MTAHTPQSLTGVAAEVEFKDYDGTVRKGETDGTVSHSELIVLVAGETYYVMPEMIVNYYPI